MFQSLFRFPANLKELKKKLHILFLVSDHFHTRLTSLDSSRLSISNKFFMSEGQQIIQIKSPCLTQCLACASNTTQISIYLQSMFHNVYRHNLYRNHIPHIYNFLSHCKFSRKRKTKSVLFINIFIHARTMRSNRSSCTKLALSAS